MVHVKLGEALPIERTHSSTWFLELTLFSQEKYRKMPPRSLDLAPWVRPGYEKGYWVPVIWLNPLAD